LLRCEEERTAGWLFCRLVLADVDLVLVALVAGVALTALLLRSFAETLDLVLLAVAAVRSTPPRLLTVPVLFEWVLVRAVRA